VILEPEDESVLAINIAHIPRADVSKWVERKVALIVVQLEYMMGAKLVSVMENQRVDRSVVQRVQ
jgi:hypothetical protein